MNGIPLPSLLKNDDWFCIALLVCTFLSAYFYFYYRRAFTREFIYVFTPGKQLSIDRLTPLDVHYFLPIQFQLSLTLAFLFVVYRFDDGAFDHYFEDSYQEILLFAAAIFVSFLLRNLLYLILGRVFTSASITRAWFYMLLLTELLISTLFLVLVWVLLYLDADISVSWFIVLIFVLPIKLLLLIKGFRLIDSMKDSSVPRKGVFFEVIARQLYFIAYLCALEIMPIALSAWYVLYLKDFIN